MYIIILLLQVGNKCTKLQYHLHCSEFRIQVGINIFYVVDCVPPAFNSIKSIELNTYI